MTLSMDPDSRNAVVGNIVEQGQAFRAVRERDKNTDIQTDRAVRVRSRVLLRTSTEENRDPDRSAPGQDGTGRDNPIQSIQTYRAFTTPWSFSNASVLLHTPTIQSKEEKFALPPTPPPHREPTTHLSSSRTASLHTPSGIQQTKQTTGGPDGRLGGRGGGASCQQLRHGVGVHEHHGPPDRASLPKGRYTYTRRER